VTPESIAEAVGAILTPRLTRIDTRSIKPFCGECATPIDPLKIPDGIAVRMPDGAMRYMGLCRDCSQSLDRADHAETVRRLKQIRMRAFS
jgi:hypothetical protein